MRTFDKTNAIRFHIIQCVLGSVLYELSQNAFALSKFGKTDLTATQLGKLLARLYITLLKVMLMLGSKNLLCHRG